MLHHNSHLDKGRGTEGLGPPPPSPSLLDRSVHPWPIPPAAPVPLPISEGFGGRGGKEGSEGETAGLLPARGAYHRKRSGHLPLGPHLASPGPARANHSPRMGAGMGWNCGNRHTVQCSLLEWWGPGRAAEGEADGKAAVRSASSQGAWPGAPDPEALGGTWDHHPSDSTLWTPL